MGGTLSRTEVRELDRRASEEFGVPSIILMENAGRSAAEVLLSLGGGNRVVICCGKGNNGGDGLVIARHLELHGREVRILLFCRPQELQGDARTNYEIVVRSRLPLSLPIANAPDETVLAAELRWADWIVDALLGTGLQGPARPPLDRVIDLINASGKPALAVDLPSGLDCDTGRPLGATVRATHTVTFVAPKRGFIEDAAKEWLGQLHVIGIGAPWALLREFGVD